MKILVINQFSKKIGGIEVLVEKQIKDFQKNGHDVFTYFLDDSDINNSDIIRHGKRIKNISTYNDNFDEIHIHKVKETKDLYKIMALGKRVIGYIHDHEIYCPRKSKQDYFKNNCHEAYNRSKCSRCTLYLTKTIQGNIGFFNFKKFEATLNFYKTLDEIQVFSNYMKNNLIQNGFNEERVKIKSVTKSPVLYPKDKRYESDLLFCGQLIQGKGTNVLLKIMRLLKKANLRMNIVGMGNDYWKIRNFIKKNELEEKVKLYGHRNDVKLFMRNSKLLVMPSTWQEPFGLVGLEANSQECPVIAFDIGGISDWASLSPGNILVQPVNTEQYIDRIKDFFNLGE